MERKTQKAKNEKGTFISGIVRTGETRYYRRVKKLSKRPLNYLTITLRAFIKVLSVVIIN